MASITTGQVTIAGTGALISNNVLAFDNARRHVVISNNVASAAYLAIGTNALPDKGIILAGVIGERFEYDAGTIINAAGTADILNLTYQTW